MIYYIIIVVLNRGKNGIKTIICFIPSTFQTMEWKHCSVTS
jgi:hypothetical protein